MLNACVRVLACAGEANCGELVVDASQPQIALNAKRGVVSLKVTSLDDRPIQIGSHYHFAEANPHLRFDRIQAYGALTRARSQSWAALLPTPCAAQASA